MHNTLAGRYQALVFAIVGVIATMGCRSSVDGDQKTPAVETTPGAKAEEGLVRLSDAARARAGIQLDTARPGSLAAVVLASAELQVNGERLANVSARVPGRIAQVGGSLGQRVAVDASLASIDSPDVGAATAAYISANAVVDAAQRTAARERDLFAKHISAEREVIAAEADLTRASADVQAAETRLRRLGLTPAQVKNISPGPMLFTLRAPIAGTIIDRHATLGASVGSEDVLFSIADLSTLWLVAKVPETVVSKIHLGDPLNISVDALPDQPVSGRVSYVAAVVSPDTRSVDVRVDVPNPGERLKPGMFARASVQTSAARAGETHPILVPRVAVQELHGKTVVFTAGTEGEYRVREVTIGQSAGDMVEVLSGLTSGERIVTAGSFTLKSQAVRGEGGGGE
ncbi:MAG: efflux RND transporter periplasmic adaptor subunit [Acidobacteriota bacterium]